MRETRHTLSLITPVICALFVFPAASNGAEPPAEKILKHAKRYPVRVARPFAAPDAAAEYARLKRQSLGSTHDPVVSYRKALEQMDGMPRYSTQFGSAISARPKASPLSLHGYMAARALGTWTSVGPGNIGGRTRTLVIHPEQPEIMYSGGVSGGVWKTVDGGQSWTPVSDRLANIAVNSMAMDPSNPDVLYIGTGEGYFREIERGTWLPLRGQGIYKTKDAGATWTLLASTDTAAFHWVNDLIVSPKDSNRIYAATRTGIQLSEDQGKTWENILDPEVNGGCLDIVLRTDMTDDWIFASCGTFEQATVYRKKMNLNREWETVLSEPGMGRTTLAIAPSDQSVIYALSASNLRGPDGVFEQGLHAVYRSRNGGNAASWRVRVDNNDPNKLNTLLLTNPLAAAYLDCGFNDRNVWITMGWYCNVIAVDPVDPDVVWAAGVDLFRSDNGGRSWGLASYWWDAPTTPSYVHADQHAIVFHPDYDGTENTTMFSATDGGIFRTINPRASIGSNSNAICNSAHSAVRFTSLNHGFGITQFYHGAPFPGSYRYLGGTQDNGTILGSDGRGIDGWSFILGGDGCYVAVDPGNTQIIYAESQVFGFNVSTDGGATFSDATNGINDSGFLFVTPFVMDPNQSQILWTGGYRLWRTDNGASRWETASARQLGNAQVSSLAVAPGNSQIVVFGTTGGFIYRNNEALSATSTTRWESSQPREGFVSSLVFEPGSQDILYATYAGFGGFHVWRSLDGGSTWLPIDGDGTLAVPDIPVHSIAIDPNNPDRLYLGTDLGVFTSTNSGRTWAVENTGFANAVTEWVTIGEDDNGDPVLFAFTHGRGAWKVDLQPVPPAPRTTGGRLTP